MMATRRPLASSTEVSEYLSVPLGTLDRWAKVGSGPRYSRVGRHRRYRWEDIDKWLDDQAGDR